MMVTAAGISPQSFASHHTTIHDSLKGRLSASTGLLCPALCKEFYQYLGSYGDCGEKDLMEFVRDVMFDCVVRQLFGQDNAPTSKVSTHLCLSTSYSLVPNYLVNIVVVVIIAASIAVVDAYHIGRHAEHDEGLH